MFYDVGLGAEVVQHFGTGGTCAVVVMKPGQNSVSESKKENNNGICTILLLCSCLATSVYGIL